MGTVSNIPTALLCFVIMAVPVVVGFSSGAPSLACVLQVPGHLASPQDSTSPYTVTATGSTYRPGQNVQVTVSGEFKGMMVQARTESGAVVGTFSDLPEGTKTTRCSAADDTWTHSSSAAKKDISVMWKPPSNDVGPVKFRVTVVQQFRTFWVGLESAVLTYSSGPVTALTTSVPGPSDAGTKNTPEPTAVAGTVFEYTPEPTAADVCRVSASGFVISFALGICLLQ